MNGGKTVGQLLEGEDEKKGKTEGKTDQGTASSSAAPTESSSSRNGTVDTNTVAKAKLATPVTSEGAKKTVHRQILTKYGKPTMVTSAGGSFPKPASILGSFFCLGELGKGTFSSIHRCLNMEFHHEEKTNAVAGACAKSKIQHKPPTARVAAAKVELDTVVGGGVMQAEAMILDFLSRTLPPGSVPAYMGHFRSDRFASIFMELLPGEDMCVLREKVTSSRRIDPGDAVFLMGDIMIPLLRHMHDHGIVHRDVKGGNCVRRAGKEFCMVDFGLSRSLVVAEDDPEADLQHPWDDSKEWLRPINYKGRGFYRRQREKADFRGTSMYASLRIHQLKEYCPRDDIWSVLYNFCDLVSGGLPWMSHAAVRDRGACQKTKEWVHGERSDGGDHTEALLQGDLFHIAMYRRECEKDAKVDISKLTVVPEPCGLSKDTAKVDCLRRAFAHLADLEFWDKPDYGLIQDCLKGFLSSTEGVAPVSRMNFDEEQLASMSPEQTKNRSSNRLPIWDLLEDQPHDESMFKSAEEASKAYRHQENFWSRLPVKLRYHLAQLDCNLAAAKSERVPPRRALRDWMQLALSLMYDDWDSRNFEDGGYRTNTDGYKRPRYLELLKKCDLYATQFRNFQCREFFEFTEAKEGKSTLGIDSEHTSTKRRKITIEHASETAATSDLVFVSRMLFSIRRTMATEASKKTAPPMRISFG